MREEYIKAREESRKRFNKTTPVTIKSSEAHLKLLKLIYLKPFEQAVEEEKNQDKRPATIAYKEISKYSEEEMNAWLVGIAVNSVINQYVMSRWV